MKTLITIVLLAIVSLGLWQTRPSKAVIQCESTNTPEYCYILEKE